jgi:hypothetical protein
MQVGNDMARAGQSILAVSVLAGFAIVAGAVGAAVAQTAATAPRGASVAGDTWCSVVLEQDMTRFQDRVTQIVAAGSEVRGSNYVVTGDSTYFYALACRGRALH